MAKIHPLGNMIVVESPTAYEEKTAGGLVLPEMATNKKSVVHAKVLEVGPGMSQDEKSNPSGMKIVKPGMWVVFNKSVGPEVVVDGQAVRILNINDIYAILEK